MQQAEAQPFYGSLIPLHPSEAYPGLYAPPAGHLPEPTPSSLAQASRRAVK
jgi:hypothetical protein